MHQFRPLPSYQEFEEIDRTEHSAAVAWHPQGVPLHASRLLGESQSTATTAPSLLAALQSTMSPDTSSRVVIIPAETKRKRDVQSEKTPPRHMHLRLRQGILLVTIFLVVLTTLLYLAPLSSGQSGYRFLSDVNQWVQSLPGDWQIAAHPAPTAVKGAPVSVASPTLPPMDIPKSQYVAIARQDAIDAGIPPDYFVRQINQESGFDPNSSSPAGAVGIAQFLPDTAAGLGIDPYNPISALRGAARLMASYAKQYGGDYAKALAAYNAGSGTVEYAVNACGSSWISCLPGETQNYIHVIMGL